MPYYSREGRSDPQGSASGRRSRSTSCRPNGEDTTGIFRPSMRPSCNHTSTEGKVLDPI